MVGDSKTLYASQGGNSLWFMDYGLWFSGI